jgi:hypothetical protein
MMKNFLILVSMLFLSISCIKDIDLSQANAEGTSFKTPINLALLNLKLTQDDFIEDTHEVTYKKLFLTGLGGILNETNKDSLTLTTHFSHNFKRNVYCHFSYRDKYNESLPISDGFVIENGSENPHTITYQGDRFEAFSKANWIYVSIRTIPINTPPPALNGKFNLQTTLGFILDVPKQTLPQTED